VSSADLNQYIQETYGPFTAKDFRTWGANIEFIKSIRSVNPNSIVSKKECQSSLKQCIESVSNKLNNTIAVCKSNYICKAIVDEYQTNPIELMKKIRKNKSNDTVLMTLLKSLL
jgi:DNA topoisomerase-1